MRLSWKIYFLLAGFVLLTALLLSVVTTMREADHALAELRGQQRILAVLAASQVEAGYHEQLWPFEMLSTIAQERSVVAWRIVDGAGRPVLHHGPDFDLGAAGLRPLEPEQELGPDVPRLFADVGSELETWVVPLRMRTESKPWSFALTFQKDCVRERIDRIRTANLCVALGVIMPLLPISLYATRRFLKPLSALTRAVNQMADGNLIVSLPQPPRDEVGDLVHGFQDMANNVRDRDERIQTQLSMIRSARDELESRVEERTVQLIVARKAAEEASRAKSEFLANMSHEIRTPMTSVLGFADVLLEDGDLSLAPASRIDAIRTIRRNGTHLLQIINDILDLSKIEAGRMVIESLVCSPRQLLADVESLMKVRSEAKGLTLHFECDDEVPDAIRSDPTRLRQILVNLVGNAIKFTDVGSVRVTARLIGSAAAQLAFDVVDTGVGLTPEQIERLFQPFSQADTSTTRSFGGTGLGLAISKRLAQVLGGDVVVVESRPGTGTTFRLTIAIGSRTNLSGATPQVGWETAAEDSLTAQSTTERPLSSSRILLAEDGLDNQRLISFVLERAGAEVVVVENGRLAVDEALAARDRGQSFDAILLDMQMPVMDGYEAAQLLRANDFDGPIIALTAHAMSGDREKCLAAGCDDYATKPIERTKLIETIAVFAGRSSAIASESQVEVLAQQPD